MDAAEAVTGQAQRHEGGGRATAWKNIHTAKAGQGPEVTQAPGSTHRNGGSTHRSGGRSTPRASKIPPEGIERAFAPALVPRDSGELVWSGDQAARGPSLLE